MVLVWVDWVFFWCFARVSLNSASELHCCNFFFQFFLTSECSCRKNLRRAKRVALRIEIGVNELELRSSDTGVDRLLLVPHLGKNLVAFNACVKTVCKVFSNAKRTKSKPIITIV